MKIALIRLSLACFLLCGLADAADQVEEFTYQGRLLLNGQPANGTFPMTFTLFDAASGGAQVGTLVSKPSVNVSGGGFGVALGYPGAFTGKQLWLEITVNGQTLGVREAVRAAPVAQFALNGARMLDYNETSPSSAASPPLTHLNSAGPFDIYASCGIDGSNAVTVQVAVYSAANYDVRQMKNSQVNDAGTVFASPDSLVNANGYTILLHPTASTGNYTRLWDTATVHSHGNPNVTATLALYAANDARVGSTGCVVQGTVMLGM